MLVGHQHQYLGQDQDLIRPSSPDDTLVAISAAVLVNNVTLASTLFHVLGSDGSDLIITKLSQFSVCPLCTYALSPSKCLYKAFRS